MKTAIRALFIAATTTLLSSNTAFAQEVTLRFQHFVPPASGAPTYFMQPWVDKVEADSNGRIKIELYPLMQLGGRAPDQYDLIRDGAIDGGWVIPGYQAGRFPKVEAMELPFMTPKSGELASIAAWTYTEKHLLDEFAEVKVLAAHMHGEGLVHKKGPALTSITDFEGLSLRAPTRTTALLLQKLGANPVGLPVPAFPEALAKGALDGGVITFEMAPSLKLDELTDSHTDISGENSLYNLYFIWAMNRDKYESMPEDLRAILDQNSGLFASQWFGAAYDRGDEDGISVINASDNEIGILNAEETAKIAEFGDEVISEWISEMNNKGYDGQTLVDDARAAVNAAQDMLPWIDTNGAAITIIE